MNLYPTCHHLNTGLHCRDAIDVSKEKLSQCFLEACALSPLSTAIITGTHRFSYQQLQKAAVQVQSILKDAGVQQSQLVAICIPRSTDLVAAILGCVLHGAVFLLVNPSMPAQRMQVLFEISRPCVVLYSTQDHPTIELVLNARKSVLGIGIHMESGCITISPTSEANPSIVESFTCSDDVFYIIFTSGSTGVPKAVCASASGTLNRFEWMWKDFPFQRSDVVCFKTSVNFVDCIWEILGTLLKGAPLAIPLEDETKDPRLLAAFMKKWKVTRVTFVPSYLRHVLEFKSASEYLQYLTHCISSGEPLSLTLAAMFLKTAPSCRLFNLYGTSEICGDVTFFEVTPKYIEQTSSSFVPIGKPIPNVIIKVIDPTTGDIIPQSSSKEGELLTFGSCVAISYLNSDDKSLSNSAFNTHDLVHYNSSGDLMYIGRRDHQIKVRGVRINPSEIEAVLEKNIIVERAVVSADESHMNLIGFIQTSESHNSGKDTSAVIEYGGASFFASSSLSDVIAAELLTILPQYLVPSLYIFTHRLPTLPSGKINRKELPPSHEIKKLFSQSVSQSLQLSKTEEQLCCLFKENLKLTSLSVLGNYFSLGGNSLSAVSLASSIQECFHREISVATILANPTIHSLALVLDQNATENKPEPITAVLEPSLNDYTGPLTYSQECTWCYEAMASCALYELGEAAICLSAIDSDILQKSVRHLAMKHESLRTVYYCTKYGHPFQRVMKFESPEFTTLLASAFVIEDCSIYCPLGFDNGQVILPNFKFDLIHGPLWKFTVFTNVSIPGETGCCNIIAFQAHHMMTDGWSIALLVADLEKIYTGLSNGENTLGTPNPSTFLFAIKKAIKERSRHIEKELQLWHTKLHGALLPPFLHPKCLLTCTHTGNSASTIHKIFTVPMTEIRTLCQANSMSEFVPVFTSLLSSIFALNGNVDILASVMLAIRNAENANITGFSVDSFPLRITLDENVTLLSLLSTVKAGILEVIENQISWYQLEKAVMKRGKLMPDSSFSSGVLNQLDFVFDYKSSMPFSGSKLFRSMPVYLPACESLLDFYINADTDVLDMHVAYSNTLYHAETVHMLLETWERMLETMVRHVYLNVPLKHLCHDISMSHTHKESTKPQTEASVGCMLLPAQNVNTKAKVETVAISLNINDVLTWSQLSLIQESLRHLLSTCFLPSVNNCTMVLAYLPFSAFAIALVTAATKLKCRFTFCSSVEDLLADISRCNLLCLIVVENDAVNEQVKKCCPTNVSIFTVKSFNCISPPKVSNAFETEFKSHNSKWQSDFLVCSEVFTTYFLDKEVQNFVTFTSPESSTFPIAVSLLLQGIPVTAYTSDCTTSFLEIICETGTDLLVIPEITVPSLLPKIFGCKKVKHLWIQGLSLALAYIFNKWMTDAQHVQVIVTHSLVHEQHLITHHLNLKDIPSIEDGSIPCIPIGSMCHGLNGKVLHRDGRDVCQGFVGSFATMDDGQIHRSTSLVRQLPNDGSYELVSVDAEAYYKGIDVTPALCVLSTIPEVTWCGVSTGTGKDTIRVFYSTDVESSGLASLHNKITHLLISTLSLGYAGLICQLPKPLLYTSDFYAPANQFMCSNVPGIHWLYSDPALSSLNDHVLPDKLVELVSKSFDTDSATVRQTYDLLCIGGNSTAVILDLTVGLNTAFDAGFTIPEVYQAIHDGLLLSLVVNGRCG